MGCFLVLILYNLGLVLFCVYLFGVILTIYFERFKLSKFNPSVDDLVIVLGTSKGLSDALKSRLNILKGVSPEIDILVSGGLTDPDFAVESFVMKCYLKENLKLENKILCESKSKNTYQNLVFSYDMIKLKGYKKIYIVSNKFHCYRVRKMCEELHISNCVICGTHDPKVMKIYIYEALAYVKYKIIYLQDKMRLR